MRENQITLGEFLDAYDPVAILSGWISSLPQSERNSICVAVLSCLAGAEKTLPNLRNPDAYLISWLNDAKLKDRGAMEEIIALRAAIDFVHHDQMTQGGFGEIIRNKREINLEIGMENSSAHEDLSRVQLRHSCGETWKELRETSLSDYPLRLYARHRPWKDQ